MEINLVELTQKKAEGWKGRLWREVATAPPSAVVHLSAGALKELLGKAIIEKEWSFAVLLGAVQSSGRLPREEDVRHMVRMVRVLIDELSYPTPPPGEDKKEKAQAKEVSDMDEFDESLETAWPSVRG